MDYWWLWVFDMVLMTAGMWFYLATNYGTYEFFAKACAMALLPLIPALVLVGGAGSTVFALTKVLIDRRGVKPPAARALLVGPALVLTLALGLLGVFKSPTHRLGYICIGQAPASASQVELAGYSTFLRAEWLAEFRAGQKDFETLVARAKLVPADAFELQTFFATSALRTTRLGQRLPALGSVACFKRVFRESEEHQRGRVYALFDAATGTAAVIRAYHD